jgi:hypothetical protein
MPVAELTIDEALVKEIKSLPRNRVAQVLDFVEFIKQQETRVSGCSICANHRNPETGELHFNAKTMAGMQEVEDMLAGKIPNTLKSFNSLEKMLADLDADD